MTSKLLAYVAFTVYLKLGGIEKKTIAPGSSGSSQQSSLQLESWSRILSI